MKLKLGLYIQSRHFQGRCLTREELIEEHCRFHAKLELLCLVSGRKYQWRPYEDLEGDSQIERALAHPVDGNPFNLTHNP